MPRGKSASASESKRKPSTKADGKRKAMKEETSSPQKKKRKLKDVRTKEDLEASAAQKDALEKAFNLGMLSKRGLETVDQVPFPKACAKCTNADIKVKKNTRAKGKYLFVLPGQMAILNEGICGTVENLGSHAPWVNIEFPDTGKTLRLHGTVVNPSNSYAVMQFKNNGSQVTCDSLFDEIVVFHSFEWIQAVPPPSSSSSSSSSSCSPCKKVDWSDPHVLGVQYGDIALPTTVTDESTSGSESPSHAEAISLSSSEPTTPRSVPRPSRRVRTPVKYASSSEIDDEEQDEEETNNSRVHEKHDSDVDDSDESFHA